MSRVIQCELILPITAKFIRVCTMYVQCMYTVYHGSWRDFTTAVGAISIRVLFAALTRHTLRLWALTRPSAQPTVPCQGQSECFVLSGDDKLTTANLCDRKKKRRGLRERYYDPSMSLRNSRLVLRRLYFISPITPWPV